MYGVRLTDDQAHVLQQLELLAKESRPDVILVSGDVYDRAVPPPDAVALLDEFLSRVVLDLGIPVMMIAGNHDSPHRLEFASRVLAGRGLYVCGSVHAHPMRMTLHDGAGPVHFCAVPYAEPALVREALMKRRRSEPRRRNEAPDRADSCGYSRERALCSGCHTRLSRAESRPNPSGRFPWVERIRLTRRSFPDSTTPRSGTCTGLNPRALRTFDTQDLS